MINAINDQAYFFNVCEIVFISIKSIIVSISIFVIKRSDYKLFFKRFFQRAVRINFVHINNDFLKIMLHSLNDEKRISFLKISAKYVSNREKDFVFIVNFLNV